MNQEKPSYTRMGLTLFLSLSAVALVVFLLFRGNIILSALSVLMSALRPIFIGIAISYILHPLAKLLEDNCRKIKLPPKPAKAVSVILTALISICAIILFFVMLVPQLGTSITTLMATLPDQVTDILMKVELFLQRDDAWAARLLQMVTSAETVVTDWLQENALGTLGTLASNIYAVGSYVANFVMAFIVAIYLLSDWDRYLAQGKKLFLAVSKNKRFNRITFTAMNQTNRIFSGFINGKLLDSLIVGLICFISLTIMKMPYTLLISVIVGVTNIVPVFGPFIGAVPSAFLILLVSPGKCLAFLVFIVILQQIDGNIIGPRILGDSTGLSALYVMTAMLIFGKLLGFLGMVIGVPLFATLYYIVKQLAEHSLRKQNMTLDTAAYVAPGIPGDPVPVQEETDEEYEEDEEDEQ